MDADAVARYGAVHFDMQTGRIEPLANPDEAFLPIETIKRDIVSLLARMQQES